MGELTRLDRKTLLEGGVVDFCRDRVRLPDGKEEDWDFIRHRKGGGACVAALTEEGKLVMVRQKRPCVDRWFWELPAGAKDAGEAGYETARREFLEETGYICGPLEKLFTVHSAPAWCDEQTEVYFARDARRAAAQHLDEAEDIRVREYSLEELTDMVFDGRITDAKTVAGILGVRAKLNRDGAGRTGGL